MAVVGVFYSSLDSGATCQISLHIFIFRIVDSRAYMTIMNSSTRPLHERTNLCYKYKNEHITESALITHRERGSQLYNLSLRSNGTSDGDRIVCWAASDAECSRTQLVVIRNSSILYSSSGCEGREGRLHTFLSCSSLACSGTKTPIDCEQNKDVFL